MSGAVARLSVRHLVGIDGLARADVETILDTARSFRDVNSRPLKKVPALRGRTILNVFFEPSTRTRVSFELAAKRLSADSVNLSGAASSTTKGETLLDTARNLEAMAPDIVVIRHAFAGAAAMLARVTQGAVVNAGDGAHEHPTQALLDAFTLLDVAGRIPLEGLDGMTVAIVGDIAHSRVARSNMLCLALLGAKVRVAGPRTMLPPALDQFGVEATSDIDEAIDGVDAVMMLRIQRERISGPLMSTEREYLRNFGLTRERAARLGDNTIIMHPGPINRGVEIAPEVADSPGAVILQQAENGVCVRMAVLYLLSTARQSAGPDAPGIEGAP